MPLQNFVDKVGPVVSAAWLNSVDVLKFTIFADAATKAAARTNLTSDAPLEITNGGTGTRGSGASFLTFLASFFPLIYQYINPRTAAEITAGVTPADYSFLPYVVNRYLTNTTPGTTDMSTGFLNAIAACSAAGGGLVTTVYGSTYKIITGQTILAGVKIDLNRSTVNFVPTVANVQAFNLRDYSAIYNGTVSVDSSGAGSPTAADDLTNIRVGTTGGSLAGYKCWYIGNLVVTNNRSDATGGTCIFVYSSSNNGIVENIDTPSSALLSAAVRVHWAGDGGSPAPGVSQHPYNVIVRNIRAGTMTKAATTDVCVVDIVGCYNVDVTNVYADAFAGDAVLQIRPGGFGSAVASAAVQKLFLKGIRVSGVACPSITANGVIINGRAIGGGAVPTTDYSIPCIVSLCKFAGLDASSTNGTAGIHVLQAFDWIIDECEAERSDKGIYIEANAKRGLVRKCRTFRNQESGIVVAHATTPEDIVLELNESWLNGQDGTNQAGIIIDTSTRTRVNSAILGDATSETTQSYGIQVTSTAVGTVLSGRIRVRNIKGGGTRYLIQSAVAADRQFNGGSNVALSTVATEYVPLVGTGGPAAAEANASVYTSVDMCLTNFQVRITAAPVGATKSRGIRIVDDGAATALEVTIVDAAVTGSDFDAVEVAGGSYLSVQSLVTNTPNAAFGKWSCEAFLT